MELLEMVNLKEKAKASKRTEWWTEAKIFRCHYIDQSARIIFLDEPTTGLDPQARRNLWELIKNIRERGTTVIITTHYMDEAEYLCDRVAIIDAGKIVAMDDPEN